MRIERVLVFSGEGIWNYKYGEDVEHPIIGSIYISKSVFEEFAPKQIKVVIEG